MRLEEIEEGKAYWKSQVIEQGGRKPSKQQVVRVYVMAVDKVKKLVLASVGGGPGKWVSVHAYAKWKIEDPRTLIEKNRIK